ncbi:MAG: hypothetical protein NXI24_08305 [bacterium]|nr:hypothetical protein [bacterium]
MNSELLSIGDMGESDYQRWLQNRLTSTGALGDVFPLMVSRNVPQYLLARLWPEVWNEFQKAPRVVMFGAAEEGWRGRLDNLRASVRPEANANADIRVDASGAGDPRRDRDGAGFRVSFRKTYVMECESLLVLARPANASGGDPEDVALVWLPHARRALASDAVGAAEQIQASSAPTWTQRTEPGLTMDRSEGPPVHHYIVEGDQLAVPAERVLRISRRKYATIATQLPRREITSMSLLSVATLRRELQAEVSPAMAEREARLLQARDGKRLSGGHMQIAREILNEFFALAASREIALHPLWDRIREMAGHAR